MGTNTLHQFTPAAKGKMYGLVLILWALGLTAMAQSPCVSTWTQSANPSNSLGKIFASTNTSLDYNYSWTFGDGTSSDSRTPAHAYTHAGKFRVCLRVSKKDSTCTSETCDSITIAAAASTCVSTWTVMTNTSYVLNKLFTATSTSSDFTYNWTFGDGGTSDSKTPDHTYLHSGRYKVCLRVTKKDSLCTSITCDSITVGSVVTCNSGWTYTTDGVNTLKKNFSSALTSNDYTYLWTFGDGTSSDSKIPVHVYSHTGKYRVCLKVSRRDSACTSTTCDSVNVSASTACEANYVFTTSGRTIHFSNTSGGSYNRMIWKFGDNTSSDQTNPTHTYTSNGTYNACLYIYRIEGHDTLCHFTRCHTVTVSSEPNHCIAGFTYGVNHNLRKVEVNNTSVGSNLTYRWTFGDDSISLSAHPAPHIYTHNGIYRICLRVINSLDTNCRSEYCTFVTVHRVDSNIILNMSVASYSFAINNADNNTIQFTNTSSGQDLTYNWNFGDGEYSTDANPLHSFAGKDWYLVCLTVTGNSTDVYCNNLMPEILTSGLSKQQDVQVSKVYPNPFNDVVKIDLNAKAKSMVTLSISDLAGKLIIEKQVNVSAGNNSFELETMNMINGIYILNISGNGINRSLKLVK